MKSKLLCLIAALSLGTAGAQAAISVGPNGTGILTFDARPPATEFATMVLIGDGTTYSTDAALDAAVQNITASSVTTQLPTSGTVPPSTFAGGFRYNTTALYLQSRPTTSGTNAAQVMVAWLQNDSGAEKTTLTVGYDMGLNDAAAGEIPGFRVFYSLSGEPNTWVLIPELSVATPGALGVTLSFATAWAPGGGMYLLWADDNANGVTDESYTIDNFSAGTPVTPITITVQPTNETVLQGRSVSLVVQAIGSGPITYQWYKDGAAIDPINVNATANRATFVITNMTANDGGTYFCQVTGPLGPVNSDNAVVTYVPDNDPPKVIFCVVEGFDLIADTATIRVLFDEPIDTNTVDTFEISFREAAGGPGALGISQAFDHPNPSNLVFHTTAPQGTTAYDFRPNNIGDPQGNRIPTDSVIAPVLRFEEVLRDVIPSHTWRVNDSNTDLGNTWSEVGYDDSVAPWRDGYGVFDGKRLDPPGCRTTIPDILTPQTAVNTCITISNADNTVEIPSVYFRTLFNFTGPTQNAVLKLEFLSDDGTVFYLNGQEINRFGMNPGPVTFDTLANRTQNDNVEYWFTNIVSVGNLLREGPNTVAVSLHQVSLTSSDLTFGLRLLRMRPDPAPITEHPRMTIERQGGNVVISWAPAGGHLESTDTLANNPAATVWASEGTSNPANIPATAAKKFYRVVTP